LARATRDIQHEARTEGWLGERPRWPMILLRSPKGWTGPKEVDGKKVEDLALAPGPRFQCPG
jgi:xylulose-5-phosphate/fructose-6-phosphate phosphoketolase